MTEADLKAPDPREPREYAALRHQAVQLASEVERLRTAEQDARLDQHQKAEAAKSSAARADQAEALLGTVTASRSWKLTRPLRRTGQRLRELAAARSGRR